MSRVIHLFPVRLSRALAVVALLSVIALAGCSDAPKNSTEGNGEETATTSEGTGTTPTNSDTPTQPPNPGAGDGAFGIPGAKNLRAAEADAFRAYIEEGMTRFRFREFVRANESFRQAAQIVPENAMVHYWLGRVAIEPSAEQDYAQGEKALRKSLDLINTGGGGPAERVEVTYWLGVALYEQDRHDEAKPLFEATLANLPPQMPTQKRVDGLIRLGTIALRSGELDDAERLLAQSAASYQMLTQAMEAMPADKRPPISLDVPTRINLRAGELAMERKDWPRAEEAFRKVVAMDQEHKNAHYRLSRALLMQEKTEDAERESEIHELLNSATDNISSKALEDTERLVKIYSRLKELMPDFYRAYAKMARTFKRAEKYDDVIVECESGLQNIPDTPQFQFMRAELWYFKGEGHAELGRRSPRREFQREQLHKARECYEKSAALAPGFAEKSRELLQQIEDTLKNIGE